MDVFSPSAVQTETRPGLVVPEADVCCLETAEFINSPAFKVSFKVPWKTLPTPHEFKLTTLNATVLQTITGLTLQCHIVAEKC